MRDAVDACKEAIEYEEKGELDQAIAAYTEAIELEPEWAEAYFFRGGAYAKKDDLERAVTDYSHVIRLNPHDVDAYNRRARAYDRLGEPDKAAADYAKAEQLANEP